MAVEGPDTGAETVLAEAVLRTAPALGILVARGALATSWRTHGDLLLDPIEEARDDLLLPPEDPAQDVFDAMGGVREDKADLVRAEAERVRLAQIAADLRGQLDAITDRQTALEQQLSERERELARDQPDTPAIGQPKSHAQLVDDERERRALRDKISNLHVQIREGNEERAGLRRLLAEAVEKRDDGATAVRAHALEPATDDDDEELEQLSERAIHPVRLPRFRAAAQGGFETVPRQVAASAMRTIGALAAGDAAAWRAVKQAKDMPRQVMIARIGIHHRLLFRIEDGALDVLDVVTRQSLLPTLKRLRGGSN